MFSINNIRDRFRLLGRKRVESKQLQKLQTELLEESRLSSTYLILIVGSCAIATLGLLANSAAVIIGAMIIAPLMLPIRGLAFGSLEGNVLLFRKGLISLLVGTLVSIVLAWSLSFVSNQNTKHQEGTQSQLEQAEVTLQSLLKKLNRASH